MSRERTDSYCSNSSHIDRVCLVTNRVVTSFYACFSKCLTITAPLPPMAPLPRCVQITPRSQLLSFLFCISQPNLSVRSIGAVVGAHGNRPPSACSSERHAQQPQLSVGSLLLGGGNGTLPSVHLDGRRPSTAPSMESRESFGSHAWEHVTRASNDARSADTREMQLAMADPKAMAFQEFEQVERGDFEVSEAVLVRDLIYCCQGIDGNFI
eukprot:753509-Prorocentrum_minimum.AAC.1